MTKRPEGFKSDVNGLVVQQAVGDGGLDHLVHQLLANKVVGDRVGVLGANHHSVHALGHHAAALVFVLHRHLGLGVGTQPGAASLRVGVVTHLGQRLHQAGGQVVRHGHALLRLVRGVTKHESLVTGTNVVVVLANVHSGRNLGTLLLNGHQDVARLVVKALARVVVADALDRVSHNLLVVQHSSRGNLSKHHNHAGLGSSLAGHLGSGIHLQAGIQDRVTDLIADFVGMALTDRLRREEKRIVLRHYYY